MPLLADASPRVRLQAAIALGKIRETSAVDALFALAERDGADPVLRHAAAFGLSGCADRAAILARLLHPSATVRLIAVVALRRQASPAVAEFLHDADPLVVAEAARAIHDDASIPDALPALAALLAERPPVEMTARRAINAGLRLGTTEAADRLAAYGLDESAPQVLRAEALRTRKVWRHPPPVDLVDGWARNFSPTPAAGGLAPGGPA
ncbi:MAG: HEAT repeat domain-containing protein, partial [Opitutaceae bacterium]